MLPFNVSLHFRTPFVTVLNNRGQAIREILYHRHPDTPNVTDERITRHQYDISGHLVSSIDPRLYEAMQQGAEVKPNFRYQTALSGEGLKTESVDAGTTSLLKDAVGRPVISRNAQGMITRWHYEPAGAGRLLFITEKADAKENITERFLYAENTSANRAHNLVGSLTARYDTAGVKRTEAISLTGVPLSVTQQLLKDDEEADWKDENAELALDRTFYRTATRADNTGAVLIQTDAKGNVHHHQYDIAGMLKSRTITLKGESGARPLFHKLIYSASGQKQREEHTNGLISTYGYEPETQRLLRLKVERASGHPKGAKVFQNLHYQYDPVGNILSVRNNAEETGFWRNQKIKPENLYSYDSLYQLVSATGREMASSGQKNHSPSAIKFDNATLSPYTRSYSYDRGDNLTLIRHSGLHSYTTEMTVSAKNNRAILNEFTDNPNAVDTFFTPGGHQTYLFKGQHLTWTARGELKGVSPVIRESDIDDSEHYHYDGGNQRILRIRTQKQSDSTIYTEKTLYLPGLEIRTRYQEGKNEPIEELHRINAGNVQILHWDAGKPKDIDNNQQRYSYVDIINSSGLEVDQNGELMSQEDYYPYGGTSVFTARNKIEADYKTIRYSGKEKDATGLYYYGYRYYQSWAGRWLCSDPAGTMDGMNLYRMVRNNPVLFLDQQGLAPINVNKNGPSLDQYEYKVKSNRMFTSFLSQGESLSDINQEQSEMFSLPLASHDAERIINKKTANILRVAQNTNKMTREFFPYGSMNQGADLVRTNAYNQFLVDSYRSDNPQKDDESYGTYRYNVSLSTGVSTCGSTSTVAFKLAASSGIDEPVYRVGEKDVDHAYVVIGDEREKHAVIVDPWVLLPVAHFVDQGNYNERNILEEAPANSSDLDPKYHITLPSRSFSPRNRLGYMVSNHTVENIIDAAKKIRTEAEKQGIPDHLINSIYNAASYMKKAGYFYAVGKSKYQYASFPKGVISATYTNMHRFNEIAKKMEYTIKS